MRDTKAEGEGVSNLPTLLHYLVYFLSKTGQDVINFKEDVTHLEAAAKCKYKRSICRRATYPFVCLFSVTTGHLCLRQYPRR